MAKTEVQVDVEALGIGAAMCERAGHADQQIPVHRIVRGRA